MTKNKFYLTSPLYYVNSEPHLGHAYTNVICDVTARFYRLIGAKVHFLTGTDEHGQKIYKAATENNMDIETFTDSIVDNFKSLWGLLNISYDDFIRTTQSRHTEVVKQCLYYLHKKEDIYESVYEGFYCVPCESFWDKAQILEGKCPDCSRLVEFISEKNYFFRLSRYQKWLIEYIEKKPQFIKPETRYNEVHSFLKNNELKDLCISRPKKRLEWGIELPFDSEYVTYVWFDALINYISAIGLFKDKDAFEQCWPADIHFIGKDILRQHAIYWPIMLKALDLEPPKHVIAHGWWLIEKKQILEKMSKSKKNAVRPRDLVNEFGVDAFRFFLLREIPLGLDGKFSYKAIIQRINSDLANDFGNLVFRSLNMISKYYQGRIPQSSKKIPPEYRELIVKLPEKYKCAMQETDFYSALDSVWGLIKTVNKSIELKKPWLLNKEGKQAELKDFIYFLAESIRVISIYLYPFIPGTAKNIYTQLGIEKNPEELSFDKDTEWGQLLPETDIKQGKPLFPRIEQNQDDKD